MDTIIENLSNTVIIFSHLQRYSDEVNLCVFYPLQVYQLVTINLIWCANFLFISLVLLTISDSNKVYVLFAWQQLCPDTQATNVEVKIHHFLHLINTNWQRCYIFHLRKDNQNKKIIVLYKCVFDFFLNIIRIFLFLKIWYLNVILRCCYCLGAVAMGMKNHKEPKE